MVGAAALLLLSFPQTAEARASDAKFTSGQVTSSMDWTMLLFTANLKLDMLHSVGRLADRAFGKECWNRDEGSWTLSTEDLQGMLDCCSPLAYTMPGAGANW